MSPFVLVITGPTATGKTALGVSVAKALNGEVVSADSMQLYSDLCIGTAKPEPEELQGVPHHMLGCISPREDYSVARYVEDASFCCDDILRRGKLPVLVGGTNLYIDSLLSGRSFSEQGGGPLREALSREYDAAGGESMLNRLREADPEAAARLHANDKKRIVRALEVFQLTGVPISEHDRLSRLEPPRYTALRFALTFRNRQDLYDRIDRRVDAMMTKGLEQEVRRLLKSGLSPTCTAMQAIGYKELCAAIDGQLSITEATDKIKQESRRYAKRQLSWLRRDPELNWITWDSQPDPEAGTETVLQRLRQIREAQTCSEAVL